MENTNTYRTWEDLSPVEQDLETYSDMYKDAYGIRPRDLARFMNLSDDERQEELETLGACIQQDMETDRIEAELEENRAAMYRIAPGFDKSGPMVEDTADAQWDYLEDFNYVGSRHHY